jgi:serine/threonine protein kinase
MADGADLERRALRIFEDALDRDERDRRAYLAEVAGQDRELLRAASRLLDEHDGVGGPPSTRGGSPRDPVAIASAAASRVVTAPTRESVSGQRLGPWEIVERIGAGGMGEVFRGRRADGAFEREVAIKRVRAGVGDEEVVARFHRERRVLAALEHEHIARLLDAGTDESGDPFLVMEFVAGERLDEYCDRRRLDVEARIRTFLAICDATQHAHRLGVLHRDLKPANILVAVSGDPPAGVPKLLDFGIAGVFGDRRLAGEPTLTIDALQYMTPAYASPEQLRREPLSPASDQYSLGVVLYELLTGTLPHDLGARSPAEMERIVSEESPPLPSQGIETQLTTPERPPPAERAARRSATTAALRRRLRGDLDRIVMMALRKEPERRYATVGDLAEDLRRFLDGRPVRAQRDTLRYRTLRFVRRNRAAVVIASSVLASITIALIVALDALAAARVARSDAEVDRGAAVAAKALAEQGLADSDAVTAFLTEMLASGDPWEMGRDVLVRDVLDRCAAEVEARFGSRPLIAARIHATIGRSYTRLGVLAPARLHAEPWSCTKGASPTPIRGCATPSAWSRRCTRPPVVSTSRSLRSSGRSRRPGRRSATRRSRSTRC